MPIFTKYLKSQLCGGAQAATPTEIETEVTWRILSEDLTSDERFQMALQRNFFYLFLLTL
jgi:hypothetical protein